MTDEQYAQGLARCLQNGRNMALDAAIDIVADCVKSGDSAEVCLRMLRDLKEMMNPKQDA